MRRNIHILTLIAMAAFAPMFAAPPTRAEIARMAVARAVSDKQKGAGIRWVAGGNHNEVLAAISAKSMFTEQEIQIVLDDRDMHATLRKAGFLRIVFCDAKRETRKAYWVMPDGFKATTIGGF